MDNPLTFGSKEQTSWLGRVYVLGGKGDYPCYRAELRAAYRLKEDSPAEAAREVVKETVSLRSLMMSTVSETVKAEPETVANPQKTALHAPFLLRLHAAALDNNLKANVLDIGGKKGPLLPLSGYDYGDLLVSPAVAKWPDQFDPDLDPSVPDDEFGYEKVQITVPLFRIHGGETRASLVLDIKNKLCKFLQAGERSLFGGLVLLDVTSSGQKKVLPISLVAEGIEFNGSLPDPTRHDDRDDARIIGRFRLEHDPRRLDGGYLLRLVAMSDVPSDVPSEAMDALEARIGGAFADLALESESPLAISLDRRPVVPPLIWPLARKNDILSLIPVAGSTRDFEMEIDRAAATVRLRTRSNYPGEAPGLASVLVERISWIKTSSGFDVRVVAGTLDAETQISLDFNKDANAVWSTTFAATKGKAQKALSVTIPLYDQAQRMLELYKQARAKAPADNHAAYLYFPVAEGWLQLGLPKEINSMPSQSVSERPGKLSVLSGKLVAGTGTGVGRGVRINDAQALSLTMHWKSEGGKIGAHYGKLQVSGAHAVFRGFLFAAETSPTAVEALPDLRHGPAATREMPIHVGGGEHRLALSGKFSWGALGKDWALDVDKIVGINLDPDYHPVNYAWLPAASNPFVSNHPLTRSAASATEPSLSRGLLPMRFDQVFSLRVEKDTALPRLHPKGGFVWEEEGVFKLNDRGPAFRGDTLLLPTLAGVEFYPLLPGKPRSIEAALRFDIPLLDELFAWSDPPLESSPPKSGKNPVPAVPKALAVTSLDMPGMREVWRVNRARMALTRTHAAFATPWQTVGTDEPISVDSLVEPYAWSTQFGVKIDACPYGVYSLNGVDYTPELAVGGLNRVFFSPEGKELVEKDIKNSLIQVAGFAASLFDLGDRLWDSRGFGMAAEATFGMAAEATPSVRQASSRSLKEGKLEHREFTLFTMPGPLTFRSPLTFRKKVSEVTEDSRPLGFPLDLHFYVRDLALVDGVFNGGSNPIESGPGITGQAFLPAAFPDSLHEWRFFEEPEKTNNVRRHDIAYGPFRFKPLRLIYAKFDNGVLKEIRIVGSMRLDLDPALSMEGATPFGPDEVYRGGDLFELILTDLHLASTGGWKHVWKAVSAEVAEDTGLLKYNERNNVIHCAIVLEPGVGGILSAEKRGIPAVIEFDLSGSATLHARLFGNTANLSAKYTVSDNGIDLDFSPSAAAPHVPREHGVWLDDVKISVLIRESKSTLRVDGSLLVMAAGATLPTKEAALAMFGSDSWRWLELNGNGGSSLEIDHQTGVLSARWSVTGEKGKDVPLLFGLTHIEFVASGEIVAIVAGMEITDKNGGRIGMASAWMRVSSVADEGRTVVDHRLLVDAGRAEHTLDISATVTVNSLIQWPLDGIMKMKADGSEAGELDLKADEWTDPGQGKAPLAPLSRVFSIHDSDARATHSLTLRLKRHRIDAARLSYKDGLVSVLEPVLLLAVAEHRLVQGDRSAVWTSLDYVTFTTASAILAATAVDQKKENYYFAPRFKSGRFRNQNDKSIIERPGIIPMSLALSGFYDPCMVGSLWPKLKQDKLIILGGSALQFRLQRGEGSLLAVMPWMHLQKDPWIKPPEEEVKLTQSGGTWHTPSAEIWSAHALKNMESVRAIGLAADLDAPAVAQRFDAAGLSGPVADKPMADVLPVEQAWFEKWENNKAVPMKSEDLISAPFFLRTLLVLARRWHHDNNVVADKPETKNFSWNVASLHPCRTDAGREGPNKGGPGLIRVEIRAERQWQVPYRELVTLVPADLVVLSRTRATLIPSYRLVAQASNNNQASTKLNAVLVERALDEDRAAMVAIQETLNTAGGPVIDWVYVPRRLDDCLSRPDRGIRFMPEIGPSGALGWPSPVGLQGLERMAARLGSELPVLSGQAGLSGQAAGFSARFQRFGWPAWAIRAGQNYPDYPGQVEAPVPEAFYFSFANRIVFDRDTQLAFDGPPARHLMPSPVRRRAPVNAGVQVILNALTGEKPQERMKPVAEPLLLPGIERTTIGRRPGVFEVAVASLTIPSDVGPFDPDFARFGRPGCSGPLAAHQLRTPRSPTLPGDVDDAAIAALTQSSPLAFRRRTYLSEVDRDDKGHFILFKSFDGNVDVVRFGSGSDQVRVAFSVVGDGLIGQNWDGKIAVLLSARASDGKEGANEVAGLQLEGDARLEIGNRTFALNLLEKDAAFSWECQGLGDAREMLRAVSADTPIRLVFGVRPKSVLPQPDLNVKITGLPPAGISICSIRLALDPGIRSVLPVSTTTIAFGDPSYDRQLASPTKNAQKEVEEDSNGKKVSRRILLAADRKQYDVASTLYLAFGVIERKSGWFSKDSEELKPYYLRITYSRTGDKDNKPITSALLTLRGAQCDDAVTKRYLLKQGEPYAIALSQLSLPEDASGRSALAPGDRLTLSVMYDGKNELPIAVDIVAEPVIAPAPCVYSVIGSDAAHNVMSVVLHAAAPLPQRIEFEDLARDLALGHVRRRGLFVWCWASLALSGSTVELVKFDRSGGAQVPPPYTPKGKS